MIARLVGPECRHPSFFGMAESASFVIGAFFVVLWFYFLEKIELKFPCFSRAAFF